VLEANWLESLEKRYPAQIDEKLARQLFR